MDCIKKKDPFSGLSGHLKVRLVSLVVALCGGMLVY